MDPFRRRNLDVFNNIRKPVRRAECDQQMNMIDRAADRDRDRTGNVQTAAQKRVQTLAPYRGDRRPIVFRMEYQMVIEAKVCLGHFLIAAHQRRAFRFWHSNPTLRIGLISVTPPAF